MNSYSRIDFVDYTRSFAIIAMIIYHFAYDLGQFGFVDINIIINGSWKLFATLIGTSFLFISGFSFWIMIFNGFNLKKFLKRLSILIFSSLAITLVTYLYLGDSFIFFGILHLLASCTVLGLLLFKFHFIILFFVAICTFIIPLVVESDFFQPKYLSWTGLYGKSTGSADFYPLLPWSSSFILGLAISKFIIKKQNTDSKKMFLQKEKKFFISRCLIWSGKNSLLIYLIHQPILIGLIYFYSRVF